MNLLGELTRRQYQFNKKLMRCVKAYKTKIRIYTLTKRGFRLSKEQRAEIRALFGPYKHVSFASHAFFTEKTGQFYKEYMPHDLFVRYVDDFYNDARTAVIMENKCFFPKLFPQVKQAETICFRVNGIWLTKDYRQTSYDQARELVAKEPEAIVKQAMGSSGGHAVFFISGKDQDEIKGQFDNSVKGIRQDIIVQRPIKQHAVLSDLNASSVNSIRVYSLLREEGVKIYAAVLRMGIENSRVDNASSGGISCGITPDGKLRSVAFSQKGKRFSCHPTSGVEFGNVAIPSFDKLCEVIRLAHPQISFSRFVAWDFTIDSEGDPVLIEANLNASGITITQLNNGPLFGEDTREILEEVFKSKVS